MTTFSKQTALALAQASEMAYGHRPPRMTEALLAIDPSFTADSFEMVGRGTSELLIIRGDAVTVLAFRGSDETGDWFKNLEFFPVKNLYGSVHGGFDSDAKKVMGVCLAEYDKAGRVMVTGHSKGGGVGVCFLNRLKTVRNTSKLHVAYFFGAPRALCSGTAEPFTAHYKGRVVRVENNNDIVCQVPPYPPYYHVNPADKVYISRSGELWHGLVPFWRTAYDKVMGRVDAWKSGRVFDGLHDHSPIGRRYVRPFL